MRTRCDVYDLFYAARNVWVGWHVTHDGRGYREQRIVVPNLDALPRTARVRVENAPWRRA